MKTFIFRIEIIVCCFISLVVFSSSTNNESFRAYLASLDKLEVPLTFNSKCKIGEGRSKSYNKALYKRYKHRWAFKPYGKLFDKDSVLVIIDLVAGDGIAPMLTTFDQEGHKHDSLNLFKKVGRDIGYESDVHVLINMNKEILITDSIKRWELNQQKNNIIAGTEKLTVNISSYLIDKKGKIRRQ